MTIKELCCNCNQCAKCPFQAACDILNCYTPNNLDENQFYDELVTKSIIETAEMLKPKGNVRLNNSEWVDLISDQFNVSRRTAKNMLHSMMVIKEMRRSNG